MPTTGGWGLGQLDLLAPPILPAPPAAAQTMAVPHFWATSRRMSTLRLARGSEVKM